MPRITIDFIVPIGYHKHMKNVSPTPLFEKKARKNMDDTRFNELMSFLGEHYQRGPVIRGTGGFRKIRWARPNQGKSGG